MPGGPARITAVSHPAFTGADATTSMIFQYDSGAHAVLTTTLPAAPGNPAAIYGTAARIETDGWFYTPAAFRVIARDGTGLERFEQPHEGRGLRGQAAEAGRCLRAGLPEEPAAPAGGDVHDHAGNGRGPPADRLVLPASLIAPGREAHHVPAVPGPAARTTSGASAASSSRYVAAPGGRGQRQGAHRADRDRGTKTANFVTERHLGFGCRHAISADLAPDPVHHCEGQSDTDLAGLCEPAHQGSRPRC